MATLAKRSLGLEVSILRSTHKALITSLMAYGLTATGGQMYADPLHRMETQHTNIAARRITGISRSSRLEILHITADVISAHNLLIRQCGISIDKALRISDSGAKNDMESWINPLFRMSNWNSKLKEVDTEDFLIPHWGTNAHEEIWSVKVEERWLVRLLEKEPRFVGGPNYTVQSIFHTETELLADHPEDGAKTFKFGNTRSSRETGLQVLLAANWRPDCAETQDIFVERLPPPSTRKLARIMIGPPASNATLTKEEVYAMDDNPPAPGNAINIEVMARSWNGLYITLAYIHHPDGSVATEGRFLGKHKGKGFPQYVKESTLMHALDLVIGINRNREKMGPAVSYFVVRAGSDLLCSRLGTWFDTGKWHLQSAAGAVIAKQMYLLAGALAAPLIYYSFPADRPEESLEEDLENGISVLRVTYARAVNLLKNKILPSYEGRFPRIPLTKEEVKDIIKTRYEIDEWATVRMLKQRSSKSAAVMVQLGLTRDVIRQALQQLEGSRPLQVTLCTIICATRFKYFEKNKIFPTTCKKCGAEDSFDHLVLCAGLSRPAPSLVVEHIVAFLVDLARAAHQINPGLPVPRCTTESVRCEEQIGVPTSPGEEQQHLELDELSLTSVRSELGFDGLDSEPGGPSLEAPREPAMRP